jgi:hypothetical protein
MGPDFKPKKNAKGGSSPRTPRSNRICDPTS